MRGSDVRAGDLFSYVDLEKRVPAKHPLRLVRVVVNEVLSRLDGDFAKAYASGGRPSIAPERLLRASWSARRGSHDGHAKGLDHSLDNEPWSAW